MSSISEEIVSTAQKLAKAEKETTSPDNEAKELLIKSLIELGPNGIKTKVEKMTPIEKRILIKILPEVKKAQEALSKGKPSVAMDEAETAAGYHQGKVYGGKPGYDGTGTVIQEDTASDDADEKLVKPSAASHNHQGDQAPEGRGGHEIKDPDDDDDDKNKKKGRMKKSEKQKELIFKSIVKLVKEGKTESEISDTLTLNKSFDTDTLSVVGDMIKFALMEHSQTGHDAKAKAKNETGIECPTCGHCQIDTNSPMFKALCKMAKEGKTSEYMRGYGMAKGGVESAELSKMINYVMGVDPFAGGNLEGIKPNPEESQVRDNLDALQNESVRANQTRPESLKVDKENKAAQERVDDLNQGRESVKKSFNWPMENSLLGIDRGGRNFNFSMEGLHETSVKVLDVIKKAKKPEIEANGINAIIEREEDDLPCNVLAKAGLLALTQQNVLTKNVSFDEHVIGASMGIPEEDVKKILAT